MPFGPPVSTILSPCLAAGNPLINTDELPKTTTPPSWRTVPEDCGHKWRSIVARQAGCPPKNTFGLRPRPVADGVNGVPCSVKSPSLAAECIRYSYLLLLIDIYLITVNIHRNTLDIHNSGGFQSDAFSLHRNSLRCELDEVISGYNLNTSSRHFDRGIRIGLDLNACGRHLDDLECRGSDSNCLRLIIEFYLMTDRRLETGSDDPLEE